MISHGLFQDWANAMRELETMEAKLSDLNVVIYTLLGIIVLMSVVFIRVLLT